MVKKLTHLKNQHIIHIHKFTQINGHQPVSNPINNFPLRLAILHHMVDLLLPTNPFNNKTKIVLICTKLLEPWE